MTNSVKTSVRRLPLTLLFLSAALVLTFGCVTRPGHNPLEGWKGGQTAYEGCPFDKTIIDDYQNYIGNLPAEERSHVNDFGIRFYEGVDGQRAVEIAIPINRIWWKHVLIYDQKNKRTKVTKYAASRYLS
jgi:hypothetical protein